MTAYLCWQSEIKEGKNYGTIQTKTKGAHTRAGRGNLHKGFFDMILPSTIKFFTDYYIVGDSYRSVWAVREYPPSTEEQAILSQLADRSGVTLRIYHRLVESMEQRKIIQNATRKNKLKSGGNDVNETIEAQGNLQDVVTLMANLRKNKEPLLHCSVLYQKQIE